MKSNFYTDVIDETIIELNESFEDTVNRLIAQQGGCRSTDSQDISMQFYCSKKGKISIFNSARRSDVSQRIYYVNAEVVTENNKTKVKIYTLHDRSTVVFRIIEIIFELLLIGLYILFLFAKNTPFTAKDLIPIPLFLIMTISVIFHTTKESNNKTEDINIMKQEIINRVEAVKRWND